MKKNILKKEDLKSGYVVKLRNGELRMVMRAGNFTKILVNPMTQEWDYMSAWSDALKSNRRTKKLNTQTYGVQGLISFQQVRDESFDIIEVYGLLCSTKEYGEALTCATEHRKLLWKRSEPKKMTVAEISEKLGFEVEIVAEAQEDFKE